MGEGRKVPIRKTTAGKKKTTRKATSKKKSMLISLSRPGFTPEEHKLPEGSTIKDLVEGLAIDTNGVVFSVNGHSASTSTVLTKDALVRIGVKTKNNG